MRVVSTQWGGWDTHSDNFKTLRTQVPSLDCALSALIGDLYDRGMSKDVTVIMWGEFGRTPRVNAAAGRDHWPRVMQALVAGGGMKSGQVIGATDRYGGEAVDRPVHLRDVFATLYQNLGIDTKRRPDHRSGRPPAVPGRGTRAGSRIGLNAGSGDCNFRVGSDGSTE